jgi:hypothetical protein
MIETPVLYITFARPEYAIQSFAAIKKARPKKLYFYSNKARNEKPDEETRNQEVRSYINQIDWDCDVKVWFRDEYVDVYTSLWGAIDWVFDNEKKAIIIEEDVVASLAFFDYIDKIIDKYENNFKVWMISGNNATPQFNPDNLSYWGTRFIHIFGWASWASRWKCLDRRMECWPTYRRSKEYNKYWGNRLVAKVQQLYYNKVFKNSSKYNPWDFIFSYNMVKNNSYCIVPKYNLVADVGLSGVHHKQKIKSIYQIEDNIPITYEINHEPALIAPTSYDRGHFYHYILKGLLKRKFLKLLNTFNINK